MATKKKAEPEKKKAETSEPVKAEAPAASVPIAPKARESRVNDVLSALATELSAKAVACRAAAGGAGGAHAYALGLQADAYEDAARMVAERKG